MNNKESNQSSPLYFPHHKRLDREKTEKYYKQCIDAGINLVWWDENSHSSVRATRKDKIIAYNLVNNKVDSAEMERVINPFRIRDKDFPISYKNYPILTQNMNTLLGEERKRFFNPIVNVINEDFVTEKLSYIGDEFNNFVVTRLISNNVDEEQTEMELEEFNRWRLNYRERRERMTQQIVEYGYRSLMMKEMFSRGFEDILIGGEEIYVGDIYGGEPVVRKGNPLNFHTLRSSESPYIEDSDIIVEDGFLPIGEVIDRYHNELTTKQVTSLENRFRFGEGNVIKSIRNVPEYVGDFPYSIGEIDNNLNVNEIIGAGRELTFSYGGYFDRDGNVRVTRVLWRGMRKVGFITYYDDSGNELKKIVPEQYKPFEGENVKWEWITEWQEGTKIGYDIYVRMQPLPFQSRKLDNPSISEPGITGVVHNVNSNKAKSFIMTGKDWQYIFNSFMSKLELLYIKNKGKLGTFPLHLMPDGWDMDKTMYYMEYFGFMVVDAFTEAKEGIATGKTGGSMNTPPAAMDLSFGNEIQHTFLMLEFIKRHVDDLTGITPQRKGAVSNRETKGGVERSVTQSSLNTEKWFSLHELAKIKALKVYVQLARTAWKGKSFKRNYILDDGSIGLLDYDDSLIQDIEMGIDISTNPFDQQLMETLRGSVDRMLQSSVPVSIIIDLYRTKDPTVLQKKIKTWEDEQARRMEQKEQADRQILMEQAEADRIKQEGDLQFKYDEMENDNIQQQLDRENDILKTTITSAGFNENKDMNNNNIPDILELQDAAIEQIKKSNEIALSRKDHGLKEREMSLKEKSQKDDTSIKKEELRLKRKDIDTKLKIAKANKNKYDKKK